MRRDSKGTVVVSPLISNKMVPKAISSPPPKMKSNEGHRSGSILSVASPIDFSVIDNAKKRSLRRTSITRRALQVDTSHASSLVSLDLNARTPTSSSESSASPFGSPFDSSTKDLPKTRRASQVAAAASKKRRASALLGANKGINFSSGDLRSDIVSQDSSKNTADFPSLDTKDDFPTPDTINDTPTPDEIDDFPSVHAKGDFPSLSSSATNINIVHRSSTGEINALAFANKVRRKSQAVIALKASIAASIPPDLGMYLSDDQTEPNDTDNNIHNTPRSHRSSGSSHSHNTPSHRRNTQIVMGATYQDFPVETSPRYNDRTASPSIGRSPSYNDRTASPSIGRSPKAKKRTSRIKRRIANARTAAVRGSIWLGFWYQFV